MSRDRRWTGSTANREWQRGTHTAPVVDVAAIKVQVLRYLADCRKFAHLLRPDDHPTEESALKVVFHQGDAQKQAVIDVYRQATRTRPKRPASGEDSGS